MTETIATIIFAVAVFAVPVVIGIVFFILAQKTDKSPIGYGCLFPILYIVLSSVFSFLIIVLTAFVTTIIGWDFANEEEKDLGIGIMFGGGFILAILTMRKIYTRLLNKWKTNAAVEENEIDSFGEGTDDRNFE